MRIRTHPTIREVDARLKKIEAVICALNLDDLEDLVDSRILSQKIKSSKRDFVGFEGLKDGLSGKN
ncbi:MAG: hypothetical protein CEN89_24 [Candidatus Berkelbacteria bacterium Licking1014_7]|uniref:Uncharacterized protein n=1 Tax=Candidatus Berkelbacteria bacterium Licking1014_7 TaxID=2017147 RepID=A0A554LKW4_9BACT|nr:MAG: hypothetical protein CEN89_24 [Candidatus Berkelbacteria bacterium Licking1014_7]